MQERWVASVEFEFDVDTEPSSARYEGDTQVDFSARAVNEGFLPQLRKAFPGNDGVNWMLLPNSIRRVDVATSPTKEFPCAPTPPK